MESLQWRRRPEIADFLSLVVVELVLTDFDTDADFNLVWVVHAQCTDGTDPATFRSHQSDPMYARHYLPSTLQADAGGSCSSTYQLRQLKTT